MIKRIHRLNIKYLVPFVAFLLVFFFIYRRQSVPPLPEISAVASNYFLREDEYSRMGFLVNSTVCKIPAIQPWDPPLIPFVKKTERVIKCEEKVPPWTYIRKTKILLNETAIRESGYVLGNIFCCYRTIRRNSKLKNIDGKGTYSRVVDSRVVYSRKCYEMNIVTEPKGEFIFVTCEPKYLDWYFGDIPMTSRAVYTNYHALVPYELSSEIQRKRKFWAGNYETKRKRPPSLIILGLDSVSRLNFRRLMPKTVIELEKMEATEILGYTKGENTWPNVIPLYTGYDVSKFKQVCYFSPKTKLDDCPFIWKQFSNGNYLTAEIQDSPRLSAWNFEKTGFVEPPTDFYFRPFMVAAHLNSGFYPNRVECIGYETPEGAIWEYIADIMDFSSENGIPIFINSWLTQLAHDDLNSLQHGDTKMAGLLNHLLLKESWRNTILIVIADHGYRYGGIRQTLAGYYEDKLPNLWVRLPETLKQAHPEWLTNLKTNARRLTAAFDVYKTLRDVANTFASTPKETSKTFRKYGISLFKNISANRNCAEAGIPDSYCACDLPIRLPAQDLSLAAAAHAAVDYMNAKIPKECSQLMLKGVKGGAVLSQMQKGNEEVLIVEFVTSPGDFVFEASVMKRESKSQKASYKVKNNVQRLSKFITEVTCTFDPILQLYCMCL